MLISSKILNGINGIAKIPGDKSISHRSIIIPSITNGISHITNILKSSEKYDYLNILTILTKILINLLKTSGQVI